MASEHTILQNNNFDLVPLTGAQSRQRTKLSDIKRENAYNNIINLIGWERFKYTFPEGIDIASEEIERAVCCGAGVFFKVPEKSGSASAGMWVCTPVKWVGVPRSDNTAKHWVTYLPEGDFSFTDEQIKKYVIIRNNFEMSSDYDFTEWTASMLNETDISEMQLIKWSRMTPIAKTIDDNQTSVIENILQRVYNGEPWAVMSDDSKLITGSPASRDDFVLRLTDETAIEKMHFLSEFHYELIRRLCNLYNIPFHTTAKSSQNLESELHNTDIFSRFVTENGLKWRRKACEDFKRVFGWDVTVELGDLYKMENKVIENIAEATANDPAETDPTDDPAETDPTPDDSGEGDGNV